MRLKHISFVIAFVLLTSTATLAAEVVYTDFFDVGGSSEWMYADTYWYVEDGWLVHNTTDSENLAWTGDIQWTDYDLSLRLRIDAFGEEGWTGPRIVVRRQADDDFIVALIDKTGGVSLHWRNPETGWDDIAGGGHWPFLEGETYEITVSVKGASYEVYVDGELVLAAVDPLNRAPQGAIGIFGAKALFGISNVVVVATD